jgi:hypothetical protein
MVASDKDILGKADALLRRHTLAPPADGSDTGGVPVLTDRIDVAPLAGDSPDDLAREVFMHVMARVEGRLAVELERRLTEHLVPQLHAAVASAIGDLHQELANAIGDAVAEAIQRRQVK